MAQGDWTAIVLAGGRGRRLGEDKAQAAIGGRTLLAHALAALPDEVVCLVVGPGPVPEGAPARLVVEDAAFGGPVAGLATGLAQVETPLVGLLAVDMPWASAALMAAIDDLREAADADAAIPVDATGREQPLCAAYRTVALRRALASLGSPAGLPMHAVVERLRTRAVPVLDAGTLADIDTPDDLAAARRSVHDVEGQGAMEDWIVAAAAALGIDDVASDVDVTAVLDVARDAAHAVQRPAAPVSTYLMGVAVARGMAPQEAAERLGTLAREWPTAP